MNLVTFNEKMAVVAGREGKERYEAACVAPLFDYTVVRDQVFGAINEELELARQEDRMIEDRDDGIRAMPIRLPFETFRMEMKVQNKATDGKPLSRYEAFVFADVGRVYFRINAANADRRVKEAVFCMEMGGRKVKVTGWRKHALGWIDLYDIDPGKVEMDAPGGQLYAQMLGGLVSFGHDAMSPNTHMASVEPATNGEPRSVQWLKARTHFTFISHGHPANKKGVAKGSRVPSDPDKELFRMAHNRRAHFKTLVHPRYRYARGRRIFVKATWVGPKEWRDEGGKQIYRILEPTDWQPGQPTKGNQL